MALVPPRPTKAARHSRDDLADGWPVPLEREPAPEDRADDPRWDVPPDVADGPARDGGQDRAGPIAVAVLVLALVLAVAIIALV